MTSLELPFKQRIGVEKIPDPLNENELSNPLRNQLWSLLFTRIDQQSDYNGYVRSSGEWFKILQNVHTNYWHSPIDEFNPNGKFLSKLKDIIFNKACIEVVGLIEFILRCNYCPQSLKEATKYAFDTHLSYWSLILIDNGKPTFLARTSEHQELILSEALGFTASVSAFAGSNTHLKNAIKNLGEGSFPDSVKDSISAVESAVKIIAKDESATLPSALKKLNDSGIEIHASLRTAIDKIYSYTSDEKGVRHALLDKESRVDLTDALFMLGACSSFVCYLVGKARAAKMISN